MSLRKGVRRRGRVATTLTTVGAIAAFQALAIVGAGSALAVTGCSFNPGTGAIQCIVDAPATLDLAVETSAADLDLVPPTNSIVQSTDGGTTWTAIGSATNALTTSITVLGTPGGNEVLTIDNNVGNANTSGEFATAITWAIDLGVGGSDDLILNLGDGDDVVVLTNTSFTLNGGGGPLLGVESTTTNGNDGDDTIDGSAATTALETRMFGGNDDDILSPGTSLDDEVEGEGGDDTLSYATRTSHIFVLNGDEAGFDVNANNDTDDAGDEDDDIDCFEVIQTGSANDTIDNSLCGQATFIPGAGDDSIINENSFDTLDFSGSAAGVVIDAPNQTATGEGTDTWTNLENFVGSDFDDTLIVDDDAPGSVDNFSGLGGVDTVDASTATAGVDINLDILDPSGADDLENIIGSAFSDELDGNDLRNQINAGDGDDFLDGQPGNDTLLGEGGNDTYQGGTGADRVSFANSPQKVTVDLSLGFATGEGDDSFFSAGAGDGVEIILGSAFNDTVSGGPFGGGGTVNFLFVGKKGNDTLTGFSGNDTLKGGGGNDTLRGVGGDDTMLAAAGNDRLFGGGGTDIGKGGKGNDTCSKVEIKTSCGKKGNPASPQAGIAGKLS